MDAVREKENTFFFAFLKILEEIPLMKDRLPGPKRIKSSKMCIPPVCMRETLEN